MTRTSLLFLSLSACGGGGFRSDGGQLVIRADGLREVATDGVANGIVAGTTLCPKLVCGDTSCPADNSSLAVDACYQQSVTGPATLDTCLHMNDPGTVLWSFTRVPCEQDALGFVGVDDQATLEVVDPAAVATRLALAESYADRLVSGDGEPFPSDWTEPPGATYRLIADQTFTFQPRLTRAEGGAPIAWNPADASLWADVATYALLDEERITIAVQEGETATGWMGIADGRWPFVEVVGVSPDVPASIEVVTALAPDNEGDPTSVPFAARAIVRDDQGGLLWGTPIQWTVNGYPLAASDISLLGPLPGKDYTGLLDVCAPPSEHGGEHTSTITARYGHLRASAVMTWESRPVADPDEGFVPDPLCEASRGCGCAGASGPPSGWPLALLFLLFRAPRRC